MSAKKEIWRLLEPGIDRWEDGDDWLSRGSWFPSTVNDRLVEHDSIGRRRMTLPEPQGWISVKKRMPTREESLDESVLWCVLSHNDVGAAWTDAWDGPEFPDVTHWMPIPQLPSPPKDPDEEAFREWLNQEEQRHFWGAEGHEVCKLAFLAGRKSVATDGGSNG